MLRILRLTDEEFELVEASIESLRRRFVVKRASRSAARNVAGSLRVFRSLRDFTAIGVAGVWTVGTSARQFELGVLKGAWTVTRYRRQYVATEERDACYFFARLRLPWNLGRVLIRPESLTDKLVDLFARQDRDFASSPEFSRRYYALTAGEDLFSAAVPGQFLDAIGARRKLWIEIHGRQMYVRKLTPASPAAAKDLAGLGNAIKALG